MLGNDIGRNDLCICGSGIMFKNCCLKNNKAIHTKKTVTTHNKKFKLDEKNKLIMTTTNELYMPIRLYYDIFDKEGLLKSLRQLNCINWTTKINQFIINYDEEASNIGLDVKHKDVPKEVFPVILAEGRITENKYLHLDLRSFARAVCIIKFIDQYISRNIMKITHAATYNKLQAADNSTFDNIWKIDYDELFSEKNMVTIDPEAEMKKMEKMVTKITDPKQKLSMLEKYHEKSSLRTIEKFPLYYYDEGIEEVDMTLKFRLIIAFEHWRGNKNFRPIDLARKMSGVL